MFPLLFVLFFLSTMNLPADFIEKGWFRTIAEVNPISFLIDGMRWLILTAGTRAAAALPRGRDGDPRLLFACRVDGLRKRVKRT